MDSLQRLGLALILVGALGCLSAPAALTLDTFQSPPATGGGAQEPQGGDADSLVRAAFELYQQRKFDEALAASARAARLSPGDYRPHALDGLIYMAQMKLKSASEALAEAITLQPKDKRLYLFKATADAMRGAKEEALAACRKALELDPSFAPAYATTNHENGVVRRCSYQSHRFVAIVRPAGTKVGVSLVLSSLYSSLNLSTSEAPQTVATTASVVVSTKSRLFHLACALPAFINQRGVYQSTRPGIGLLSRYQTSP